MKRRRDRKQRERDRQQRDRQDRDQRQRDQHEREQQQEAQEQAPRGLRLWDELGTVLLALLIALLVRTFVFQTFYVPSSSMFPSLLIGDHVFVNKFVYGPNLPFSSVRVPGLREPKRGEVVVFRLARGPGYGIHPADQHPDLPTDNFVKRLVGLPGDTIVYRKGRLILNGARVPMQNTGRSFRSESGRLLELWVETLGECKHLVLDDPDVRTPDMKETTVPAGRYFFMGDNRDNSLDGRRAGTVRLAELVGPVGVNYWSWDWNGGWLELLNPLVWYDNLRNRMRWERMFQRIECLGEDELRQILPEGAEGGGGSEPEAE